MTKSFYIVVYDISDDRRRTRLHDRLLDYGSPVQYSVFECLIDARQLEKLHKMIKRTIKAKDDHVRVYCLCEGCLKKTWISDAGQDVLHETVSVVV